MPAFSPASMADLPNAGASSGRSSPSASWRLASLVELQLSMSHSANRRRTPSISFPPKIGDGQTRLDGYEHSMIRTISRTNPLSHKFIALKHGFLLGCKDRGLSGRRIYYLRRLSSTGSWPLYWRSWISQLAGVMRSLRAWRPAEGGLRVGGENLGKSPDGDGGQLVPLN